MDNIVKRIMESKRLDESVDPVELIRQIKFEVMAFMIEPKRGFSKDEVEEYSRVESKIQDEFFVVEVRAELGYDSMIELAERLDKIVAKYDKDAYFDQEEPGIMSAYIQM